MDINAENQKSKFIKKSKKSKEIDQDSLRLLTHLIRTTEDIDSFFETKSLWVEKSFPFHPYKDGSRLINAILLAIKGQQAIPIILNIYDKKFEYRCFPTKDQLISLMERCQSDCLESGDKDALENIYKVFGYYLAFDHHPSTKIYSLLIQSALQTSPKFAKKTYEEATALSLSTPLQTTAISLLNYTQSDLSKSLELALEAKQKAPLAFGLEMLARLEMDDLEGAVEAFEGFVERYEGGLKENGGFGGEESDDGVIGWSKMEDKVLDLMVEGVKKLSEKVGGIKGDLGVKVAVILEHSKEFGGIGKEL